MTNPTPLDLAVRKLLTTKNHVGAMIDMIRIWGMEDVPRDEGHMHRLSKHPGDVLLAAMYRVHFKHEDLLADGQQGVGVWTEYLSKVLPFQAAIAKLETVGAPEWSSSAKKDAAAHFRRTTSFAAEEIREAVNGASDDSGVDAVLVFAFPKLGAERRAS